MKYILLIIMTLLSVYSTSEEIANISTIKEWINSKPWCKGGFWIAIGLAVATIWTTWIDDRKADTDKAKLHTRLDCAEQQRDAHHRKLSEASNQIQQQSEELEAQKSMLAEQKTTLARQQEIILEQSKAVGSLLFNTKTSFEGKERFLQSFDFLAALSNMDARMTGFEGLICDDGVPMFWFDAESETITGFYFFTNAEINRILRGLPVSDGILGKDGKVKLENESELSMAFAECLLRKTPLLGNNQLEMKQGENKILQEIETILRYVYRAENIQFHRMFDEAEQPIGSYTVSFKYAVNPLAQNKIYRSIGITDLEISKPFLDSLRGLTMAEFSERVIAQFRNKRLEPKVRVKDIRELKKIIKERAYQDNTPYGQYRQEGVL